jgi:hypothetical protein
VPGREPNSTLERRSVVPRIVIVLLAALCLAACDSTSDRSGVPVSATIPRMPDSVSSVAPTTSATAGSATEPVVAPVSEGPSLPRPPASSRELASLPIELVINPATALPGQTVTVSFLGDVSQGSVYGPAAHIERRIDGGWHSEWNMLNEDFSRSATSIVEGGPPTTIPAIGYPLTTDLLFVLPTAIANGDYRFCLSVSSTTRTAASPRGYAIDATVCAQLTIA